jgi:hypothetical protein
MNRFLGLLSYLTNFSIHKRKNQTLRSKTDITFKILRLSSLMPIIAWPMVFYMSIFFFDNPNANPLMVWGLFIVVNLYPLILIGNLLLGNWIYKKYRVIGYLIVFWPIILFGLFMLEILMN